MSTQAQPTCEDRIDRYLAGRIEDLTEIVDIINNDGGEIDGESYDADGAYELLSDFPLSVSIRHTMVVQIGVGGPQDQFEVEMERNSFGGWELADDKAVYRFMDWFDGAERMTRDDAVMFLLEYFAEIMYEG
jgi:hypothetical protein